VSGPTLLHDLHLVHDWLTERNLLPPERRVDSLPTPYIEIGGRRLISFCSNN
jgi:hypothetical protein